MSKNNTKKEKLDSSILKVAFVTALSSFIAILDGTIVSVATPTFMHEFDAPQNTVVWVMTAYTLALAMVIPLTGWAAEKIGSRNLFMIAMTIFVVGSALCALSPNLGSLIVARVIQGFGGGMLMPLGMIIVTKAAGAERLAQVMAFIGIPIMLGPILGPVIGGYLIDNTSWHWIFLINVPLGIIAVVYGFFVLPREKAHHDETFDFRGMLILSPGLASLFYGLTSLAESKNIFTFKSVSTIIIGVVLIAIFIIVSKYTKNPLLELKVLLNKQFSIAMGTVSLFMIAVFGSFVIIPLYFMLVRGETAMHTGLYLAPQGIGAMISMPIAGQLADKYGAKPVVIPGLILSSAGLFMLLVLNLETSYVYVGLSLFIIGLGMGMSMMPSMTTALKTLKPELISKGTTLSSIIQQIASTFGTAMMTVIWTRGLIDRDVFNAINITDDEVRIPMEKLAESKGQTFEIFKNSVLTNGVESMTKAILVGGIIAVIALIPAYFLPRKNSGDAENSPIIAAGIH